MTAKKTLAAAALSALTIVGATATTTTTAQANEAVAAGIGFVAGTIIGGAVASQPRVYHAHPTHVVVHGGGLQPWTPAWYSYCSNRYRSFNPNTGYFLAYSGNYVFCR
ncbi:MAG: BA14K family protein [Devosiaceae bacterium]|nr:BA14K family protein [Devosiaceae bacterium MH13]